MFISVSLTLMAPIFELYFGNSLAIWGEEEIKQVLQTCVTFPYVYGRGRLSLTYGPESLTYLARLCLEIYLLGQVQTQLT